MIKIGLDVSLTHFACVELQDDKVKSWLVWSEPTNHPHFIEERVELEWQEIYEFVRNIPYKFLNIEKYILGKAGGTSRAVVGN
jgi:hypothetical protein